MKNQNQLTKLIKASFLAATFACSFASFNAYAGDEENDNNSSNYLNDYADEYFSDENIELTPQELQALKLTQDWKDTTASTSPVRGPAGSVQFIYGGQSIDIVCAVLQVCDIQLQPGEEVNQIHIGDGARWTIEPALTGYGASAIINLVVKPLDANLKTNLLVTTNRRAYHINLKSHKTQTMPEVSFYYPEEAIYKFKVKNNRQQKYIARNTITKTNEYLGDLDFNYKVSGDDKISWIPVRVYNDGKKTIIQLDEKTTFKDIPTLLVLDKSSDKETLVNYRFINNKFIVDSIFKEAILISGVGSDQEKVTITKIDKE